ncbi:MAG: acyltransferase [Candidatus Latescibacteria bacterium]|nr:acyltransferase [Candidatus Latescibacterota bacterium]
MRIGFYQFSPIFGDKQANHDKIAKLFNVNTDLIVLPELCNTGYLFKSRTELKNLAENIPNGETTRLLMQIARKKNLAIVAGLAEKYKGILYNSSVFVTPSGKVHTYRKAHLFCDEKFYFTRGNTKFQAYKYKNSKIGMLICFDYIFPEACRSLVLHGAEIVCQPANLILPYAERVTISRAIENRVFIVLANRIGFEKRGKKHIQFIGRSQIVTPTGEVIAKASYDEEEIKIVNIYHKLAINKNVTKYNNILKDRRVDLYFK